MSIKKVLQKEINGLPMDFNVEVFNEGVEAINEFKWDSLAYASNEDTFITITADKYCFSLVTNGLVEIYKKAENNTATLYTNDDYETIRTLLKDGVLYSEEYDITNTNSFQIEYGIVVNSDSNAVEFERLEDPVSFNSIPESIDDLIIEFAYSVEMILQSLIRKPYVIGEILEDGTIEKDYTDQGLVYKNQLAFITKKGTCYVPELSETEYTYDDFLEIAKGNHDIASQLFYSVDWQSPSTLYDEWIQEDEINECTNCKKAYFSYEVTRCPYCSSPKVL